MKTIEYTVKDPLGIHARPAGLLVKAVKKYKCDITIYKDKDYTDAKKIFGLMGLSVKCGDKIKIECKGLDEEAAASELKAFLEANL
jgi:phosphocarrier protein